MSEEVQYVSPKKHQELRDELSMLETQKIPGLAQRIDDARQLGDLSENAEYHAAREEMAWAQSRAKELRYLLENVVVIDENTHTDTHRVGLGSKITVKVNGSKKEYVIVGAQEADPLKGMISNESPLGAAFMGKKKGETVEVKVPSGIQLFTITDIE